MTDTPEQIRNAALDEATNAWMDDRGIYADLNHWRESIEIAIDAYLAALGHAEPCEPVAVKALELELTEWERTQLRQFAEIGQDFRPYSDAERKKWKDLADKLRGRTDD